MHLAEGNENHNSRFISKNINRFIYDMFKIAKRYFNRVFWNTPYHKGAAEQRQQVPTHGQQDKHAVKI